MYDIVCFYMFLYCREGALYSLPQRILELGRVELSPVKSIWGFPSMRVPPLAHSWMVCSGKSHLELSMDDDWGVALF